MFHFINRNVRIFILSDVLYYGGYDLLNAFLSVLITIQIAPGRLDILGAVLSYSMILRALSEYPLSKLTTPLPPSVKKNIVAISMILYGILIGFLGFSTSIWHLFALQTGISLLEGVAYPIKWALFSKILDKKKEEIEWSLEDALPTLAAAIFSALGGIIANFFGLHIIFLIFAGLFMGSGISFFFIRNNK